MSISSRLTFLGHATLLFELDEVRLLTDPILRGRVTLLRHLHPPIHPTDDQSIDAVLLSHLHFDHLDLPSLRKLGLGTRLIVPRGAGAWLQKKGFSQVEEIAVGQTTLIKGVTIKATYARHIRRRYPLGPAADCLGFMIEGAYRIYFAGDTDLFPEMVNLADQLDVALLPVWGWGPFLGKGHMNPHRAAQTLRLLRPRLAIPIHWGSLHPLGIDRLKPRYLTRPPYEFVHHAARLAPEVETLIVAPSQSINLADILV
jgi:L-ascorbate metabolism protein UlaG (beta-lactamase superfamily)